MTVKIPISADVTGVAGGMDKLEQSARKVERAVDGIGKASDRAAVGLKKVEDSAKRAEDVARRLANVQGILSKDTGKPVSDVDAKRFIENFDRIRANRFISGTAKLRQFGTFEAWHAGNAGMFVSPIQAANYQRRVMAMGMQGTGMSLPAGNVPGGGRPGPGGGGGRPGGGGGGGMGRAAGSLFGLGKGFLALAGIGGLASIAAAGAKNASEEAIGTDALKRSLGDLGVDFNYLRSQVRATGQGLGITYLESIKLAQQFARTSNASDPIAVASGIRTAGGFARAYGLEPGAASGFFGQMSLMTGGGDAGGRKLAMMIAESIEKGRTPAKADEVMQAVLQFTTMAARFALAGPNVGGFAGALAAGTRMNIPGLDVTGTASILSAADSAVRRGGGMGEASLNFMFSTLRARHPGLDPITGRAIMESGAFGSADSTFGRGALRDYYKENGIAVPRGESTNMSTFMDALKRMYSDPLLRLDAVKNAFSLQSYGQAAALSKIADNPEQVGGMEKLLRSAGVDFAGINPAGIQTLAKLTSAEPGGVRGIGEQLSKRTDLSDAQRGAIQRALRNPDSEYMRIELAKVVATLDREHTVGSDTLEAIKGLSDTLTLIGYPILGGVNAIKNAITAIAKHTVPGFASSPEVMRSEREEAKAAGIDMPYGGVRFRRGKITPASPADLDPSTGVGLRPTGFRISGGRITAGPAGDVERQAIIAEEANRAGIDPAMLERVLKLERSAAGDVSPKGAVGEFQNMPSNIKYAREHGIIGPNDDPTQLRIGARVAANVTLKDAIKRYGDNWNAIIAYYNGGKAAGDAAYNGLPAPNEENRRYLARSARLDEVDPSLQPQASAGDSRNVNIGFSHEITVRNPMGQMVADPVTVRNNYPLPMGQ